MQMWKERQGVICVMTGGGDKAAVTNKRGNLLKGGYTTSIKFLIQGNKPYFLSCSLYIILTQLSLRQ